MRPYALLLCLLLPGLFFPGCESDDVDFSDSSATSSLVSPGQRDSLQRTAETLGQIATTTSVRLYLSGTGQLLTSPATTAATLTLESAAGGNYDGRPTRPVVLMAEGLQGAYSGGATRFSLPLDAGSTVANGSQARVSYDFEGDGQIDRQETYAYFASNNVPGWETYRETQGLRSATGSMRDFRNGSVRLEIWNAIGRNPVALQCNAVSSYLELPLGGGPIAPTPTPSPWTSPTPTDGSLYPAADSLVGQPASGQVVVPSAGGANWDGKPRGDLMLRSDPLWGRYGGGATTFELLVDAGTSVACATQARLLFDFDGDGDSDRSETYAYFPTDAAAGWEKYGSQVGLRHSEGAWSDFRGGTVTLQLWSALGRAPTSLRLDGSRIVLPLVAEPSSGQNRLVVIGTTADPKLDGTLRDPVEHVTATPYDATGTALSTPRRQPFSQRMEFLDLPTGTTSVRLDYNRGEGYALAQLRQGTNFPPGGGTVTLDRPRPTVIGDARSSFTVRIVNRSSYPDDQVFVSVNGKNPEGSAFYYVRFGPGDQNSSERFGGVARWAEYSQPLSALRKEADHVYSFVCPKQNLVSGRIYLSFGQKLRGLGLNDVNSPLTLQTPSATGGPDAQTLYEFVELSATGPEGATTLWANTSVVDFFSVGVGMTFDYFEGINRSQSVGFVEGARAGILAELEKPSTPAEFRNYVKDTRTGAVLRVLSPTQQIPLQPVGPLARFLDSAIDSGWRHYQNAALNITDTLGHPYGYRYAGSRVVAGILRLTCTTAPTADPASLGEVCNLLRPSTRTVFFCDEEASSRAAGDSYRNAGTQGHKRLVSLISAALNRGVFESYSSWADSSAFYTRPDGKYNHYAKIMHLHAIAGKVYGFAYDDVYGQDPTLVRALPQVNQVVITIPNFSL